MHWLRKTIEKHNNQITYVDHEETWTVKGWIYSLIILTICATVPCLTIAAHKQSLFAAIFGIGFVAFVVWWHFWHTTH